MWISGKWKLIWWGDDVDIAKYKFQNTSDIWKGRQNIINRLPFFSEQSGLTISPFLNKKWIIKLFPGIWFIILENRKFWDVTSPGPLIPDEGRAWWQLRRVTGIKPSNSQTASNLLTWLAPNQYFTISLENLNTKNIHRSENWQHWGDLRPGLHFPCL